MTSSDVTSWSVRDLAAAIQRRQVSVLEVTQAFLRRIEQVEPRVHAIITVTADHAVAAAKEADQEIAHHGYRGMLHGIPIGLKDLFATKAMRTTSGSKIFADYVPTEDASVVSRLRQAGAIIVAKLMMTEFAFGEQGRNQHYGDVHNPWDLARMPGGSSTGSAASVAACECAISLGSDTGGSIRVPAALCGLVGLKPTFGLVSRSGMTPLSWSLDHPGPLSRSVEGIAAALEAIAGEDPRDETTRGARPEGYLRSLFGGINKMRLGVPREYIWDLIDPEIEAIVRRAFARLQDLGATLTEVSIPHLDEMGLVMSTIIPAEAAAVHRQLVLSRGNDYDRITRMHVESGLFISATDYFKAQQVRHALSQEVETALSGVDALVMPTVPVSAPRYDSPIITLGTTEFPVRFLLSRITRVFNPGGWPAVTVPCGYTAEQLPVGMQIVGKRFTDALILRIAYTYEQASDWHSLIPSV